MIGSPEGVVPHEGRAIQHLNPETDIHCPEGIQDLKNAKEHFNKLIQALEGGKAAI